MPEKTQLHSRRTALSAALGAVAASALVTTLTPAEARAAGAPDPDPLLGSWLVQVHFVGPIRTGETEQTLITFTPGGGVTEIDGLTAQAHAGSWAWLGRNTYQYTLIELMYAADGSLVSDGQNPTIVRPQVKFTLSADGSTFQSTTDVTTVYMCAPDASGGISQVASFAIPNVSVVTARRVTIDFTPPTTFPF